MPFTAFLKGFATAGKAALKVGAKAGATAAKSGAKAGATAAKAGGSAPTPSGGFGGGSIGNGGNGPKKFTIPAIGAAGALIGGLSDLGSHDLKILNAKENIRQISQKIDNTNFQGTVDIRNAMAIDLANRLSGSLGGGGTAADIAAQQGRNMEFDLRSKLHEMQMQQVAEQNDLYAAQAAKKNAIFGSIVSAGMSAIGGG